MTNYESFPVPTDFRRQLIEKLGLIALAEKHIPQVVEGLYDKTLDELRVVTESALREPSDG